MKLLNIPPSQGPVSAFDAYGQYEITEVMDYEMLESIGGGATINYGICDPKINIVCTPPPPTGEDGDG